MKFLRSLATLLLLAVTATAFSFDRTTYYAKANGKSGAALKTALYQIVGNPNVKSYGSLWTYYYQTDRASNGQVIDRYSNEVRYFSGNTGSAVSGMNKEHGIPKSWWGGGTTGIGSDLHHVMPSDASANSAKSNYGMGVVTSNVNFDNGSIRVGRGTAGNNGYTLLWEPADNWKGDFARIYFYIVTAYEEKSLVQQQGANSMQANTYPKLQPWAYELYMKWSQEDPVDDLERQRNETVYGIQGNRNPFVDFPGLEQYVWGSKKTTAVDLANYDDTPDDPDDPDNPDNPDDPDDPTPPADGATYERLVSNSTDFSGTYLIVYEGEDGALALNGGAVSNGSGNYVSVALKDGSIPVTTATEAAEFFVTRKSGGYAIQGRDGHYIGHTSGNALNFSTSDDFTLTLSVASGEATIASSDGYTLRYNSGANLFRFYKSGQQPVALYRRTQADGIPSPVAETPDDQSRDGKTANGKWLNGKSYDLTGRPTVASPSSRHGLYIRHGKKYLRR